MDERWVVVEHIASGKLRVYRTVYGILDAVEKDAVQFMEELVPCSDFKVHELGPAVLSGRQAVMEREAKGG